MIKHSLILLSLIFSISCVSAADTIGWIPAHIQTPELRAKLREIYHGEMQQGMVSTLLDDKKSTRNFGFSAPGLNPAQEICLVKINTEFVRLGKRPRTRDDAAGFGFMSWKMLVAGGHVTATEFQKETAKKLQQNICLARPFLQEGETIKGTCKIILGNILKFEDNNDVYPSDQKFYLSWSGLFLHFTSPPQAQGYVNKLFSITESNGYVIATVNPPSKNPQLISYYRAKEKEGAEFPGYCVFDKQTIRTYTAATDRVEVNSEKIVKISPNTGTILPGEVRHGYFGKESTEPDKTILESTNQKLVTEYHQHIFMHYIDYVALRQLFEKAGFVTEDIFYIRPLSKLMIGAPSYRFRQLS